MGKLIYATIESLDGYVAGKDGDFDWAEPDKEVHSFANDLERPIGTYLYGRRMYEVMVFWETVGAAAGQPHYITEFAELWKGAEKIVYSRTLAVVSSVRTRIQPEFDPEGVRRLKATEDRSLTVGGAHLAGHALRAGLVDELQVFVAPVIVGGGTKSLPDDVHVGLELLEERRFASGFVYLHYRVTG
jgi:dihydrofolate reductase